LNHAIAGLDRSAWPEEGRTNDERDAWAFVKERKFEEISEEELEEPDRLADLLAREPAVEELVAFYRASNTLRPKAVEDAPRSFVSSP
jgi:hypothetical protein